MILVPQEEGRNGPFKAQTECHHCSALLLHTDFCYAYEAVSNAKHKSPKLSIALGGFKFYQIIKPKSNRLTKILSFRSQPDFYFHYFSNTPTDHINMAAQSTPLPPPPYPTSRGAVHSPALC